MLFVESIILSKTNRRSLSEDHNAPGQLFAECHLCQPDFELCPFAHRANTRGAHQPFMYSADSSRASNRFDEASGVMFITGTDLAVAKRVTRTFQRKPWAFFRR